MKAFYKIFYGPWYCEEKARRGRDKTNSTEIFPEKLKKSKVQPMRSTTFKVLEGVSRGGFGVVVKVQVKNSFFLARSPTSVKKQSSVFAMKVIPKHEENILREVQIMRDLKNSSPFIQKLHDAYETATSVFIVSEFIGGGDAYHYFGKMIQFSERQVRIILAELFLGLRHVHLYGYLHCDVKAENIMFDRLGHVKIVDFGMALNIDVEVEKRGGQMPIKPDGSLPYMAPELLSDNVGGRHTDWWAFGIFAYELFTGCCPWLSLHNASETRREILSRDVTLPLELFSEAAKQLIEGLLKRDYKQRLGTKNDSEITKALLFEKIDWTKTAELRQAPAFLPPQTNCTHAEERASSLRMFMKLVKKKPSNETVLESEKLSSTRSTSILKPFVINYNEDEKAIYCTSTSVVEEPKQSGSAIKKQAPPPQKCSIFRSKRKVERSAVYTTPSFDSLTNTPSSAVTIETSFNSM